MDLSGRWEFSFDRTLNGQLVPTSARRDRPRSRASSKANVLAE